MGHPLKGYAKHVQAEIKKDKAYEIPAYTTCLRHVQETIGEAMGSMSPDLDPVALRRAIKNKLVELIKPKMRKVGDPLPLKERVAKLRELAEHVGVPVHLLAASGESGAQAVQAWFDQFPEAVKKRSV
jgi:hypothetical protein